jgi:hypothetical protein
VSRGQNAKPNRDITIGIGSCENVSQLKYLGNTVTNQNLIQVKIKRRSNSGNASYHSVPKLRSSRLLSESIILSAVLYACETWSLTLRQESRLKLFENRVLRRMYGPKRDEVWREWRQLHNDELRDLNHSPSIIKIFNSRRMKWAVHVARMVHKRNAY